MAKLVIFDGNAVLHRAYHALPPLTSNTGAPINAVYGFVSMLLRVITDLKPNFLAVTFDTPKPTFRHVDYVGYQAHRPRTDSELSVQFDVMYKVLEAMRVPMYKLEGYEADDVIGTIAKQASTDEVVIVTGDRDILQLVDEKVKVYMPVRGMSEGKLYGDEEVEERLGVKPTQVVDYKALVGDPSDNYPGVPGIGPKTALGLIKEYDTLENIYKNLGEIPERVAKKLAAGAESAGMCKKLATIVNTVPVTMKMKDLESWDVDSKETLKLFEKIGFRTLSKRVAAVGKEVDRQKQMTLV